MAAFFAVGLLCLLSTPYLFLEPLIPTHHTNDWTRRDTYPQQLRLSFGEMENERILTFATPLNGTAEVAFGTTSGRYQHTASANTTFFAEENERGFQYIHSARLQNLKEGFTYYYTARLDNHTSPEYSFSLPARAGSMKFVVFGDLGFVGGGGTIDRIRQEEMNAEDSLPVAVIHTGDIAYHLNDGRGMVGDLFFQMMEPITARVPYMTCVGNHERGGKDQYRHYINRFRMPGAAKENGNMWYSWDAGLVHFIALTTDHIDNHKADIVSAQREWLIQDLEQAQSNRAKRPWIIVYAHHPMYCSNSGEYCALDAPVVQEALEDILMKYGVDMYISSHQHSYERLWPVVKGQVLAHHYDNLKAPFQVISGSGGCPLVAGFCFDPTFGARGPWSAFRWWFPAMTGYDRMVVHNSTHITWEHVLTGGGFVVDSVTIVQPDHGPF